MSNEELFVDSMLGLSSAKGHHLLAKAHDLLREARDLYREHSDNYTIVGAWRSIL